MMGDQSRVDIEMSLFPESPAKFYVDEQTVLALADAIGVAACGLRESRGLRVVPPTDPARLWAAAHCALAAATGSMIEPVFPEWWVELGSGDFPFKEDGA